MNRLKDKGSLFFVWLDAPDVVWGCRAQGFHERREGGFESAGKSCFHGRLRAALFLLRSCGIRHDLGIKWVLGGQEDVHLLICKEGHETNLVELVTLEVGEQNRTMW